MIACTTCSKEQSEDQFKSPKSIILKQCLTCRTNKQKRDRQYKENNANLYVETTDINGNVTKNARHVRRIIQSKNI